jgi:gamma-glutamylcyclotransferase (GGCT)/AIG2-like uncharacterized protein YtfP
MATIQLFVYGTLKRGQRNNRLLAGQEFVSVARTVPGYRLYDCGAYPGLVADAASGGVVQGELWRVGEEALPDLDAYEGVPDLYARRNVEVEGIAGPVIAYFYERDVSAFRDCGGMWE